MPPASTPSPPKLTADFGPWQAARLTLVFWAVAYVVFRAPVLKSGQITLWENVGYLVVVLAGLPLSAGVYMAVRAGRGRSRAARLAAAGGAAMAAAVIHSLLDHWIIAACIALLAVPIRMPSLIEGFVFNILIYVWVYGLYASVVGLMIAAGVMREQERRLAAATAAAQEAQLMALRFQINPHFLFNALNAATSLIGAGRNAEAETVVARLAEFFRASLNVAPGDLGRLSEELDAVGSYLDIEAARFGDRLSVDIDLPDELRDALTPHFLLQPLVENAIKHGVARAKRPVRVQVAAQALDGRLVLQVADDAGIELDGPAAEGAGVGLANVAGRLAALYGEGGALRTRRQDGSFLAEVVLPLAFEERAAA